MSSLAGCREATTSERALTSEQRSLQRDNKGNTVTCPRGCREASTHKERMEVVAGLQR